MNTSFSPYWCRYTPPANTATAPTAVQPPPVDTFAAVPLPAPTKEHVASLPRTDGPRSDVDVPELEESEEMAAAFADMAAAQGAESTSKAKKMVVSIILIGIILAASPFIFSFVMGV